MTDTHIRIDRVSKRFGEFTALNDVSLDIHKGEFVCFLGPSGCGKTTLLRAVAGLDMQSDGRIYMNGSDVSDLPPAQRDFGIVFQSYALFPNLSVADNVSYGMHGKGIKRADMARRVQELLTLVGLPDQGKKHPAQLSGGQQQRVALARALATSPGLILLDEPLSALDARVRAHLRKEIKDLQRNLGVTTIMVTHDQEEAMTMADRIVVMRGGRIEQVGTPAEVYANPANAFVASFIGEMNFVPAQVQDQHTIRIGGKSFKADTSRLTNGQRDVLAAIRPEDIVINGVQPGQANTLDTAISESEYLGPVVRARLSGGDLDTVQLRADLSMNLVRAMGLSNGVKLPVTLPLDRLRVYHREAA